MEDNFVKKRLSYLYNLASNWYNTNIFTETSCTQASAIENYIIVILNIIETINFRLLYENSCISKSVTN